MNHAEGYLEILDKGFGFLRSIENNFQPGPSDPFVPAPMIKQHNLPEGAYIVGAGVKAGEKNTNLKLTAVETINGLSPEDFSEIIPLQSQTSINPLERFRLAMGDTDLTGKALDMLVPIGRGQRGLIISPPKAGKTTLLKHMANAITAPPPQYAGAGSAGGRTPRRSHRFQTWPSGCVCAFVLLRSKRGPTHAHHPDDHERGHPPRRDRPQMRWSSSTR